jgi:hypothetical protein
MTSVSNSAYPAGMDYLEAEYIGVPYARSGDEIRQVLAHALAGIERYGYGEVLSAAKLARPWGDAKWQDNAWLRGVRDILGKINPQPGQAARDWPPLAELYDGVPHMREISVQGSRVPVHPGWPPPQTGEAWSATLEWLAGQADEAPACEHGGVYACGCQQLAAAVARGEAWAIAGLAAYPDQ